MDNLAVKFGEKLRTKRKERSISQDDLALKSGIDITLEKVYQLATVLECGATELLPTSTLD
jgi:transcriptional regulator with XRE-family HTH domain